jgi:hypothetical protein
MSCTGGLDGAVRRGHTLRDRPDPAPADSANRLSLWTNLQDTVYHVFSNGGFLFLSAVLLNQKRGAICKNLVGGEPKGIIVDSAPGDITPDMAARGFGAAALKTHSDGFGDSFRLGVQAARATFGAYLNLPPIKRRMQVRAPATHACSVRPALSAAREASSTQ